MLFAVARKRQHLSGDGRCCAEPCPNPNPNPNPNCHAQPYPVLFSDADPVLVAELWSPATRTFAPMAPIAVPRNYHSVAVLLPDGTVFSGGGGLCGNGCRCATTLLSEYIYDTV